MKLKTWQIIIIVALIFIILVNVLYGTKEVVPYYPENIFSHMYPYSEGFDSNNDSNSSNSSSNNSSSSQNCPPCSCANTNKTSIAELNSLFGTNKSSDNNSGNSNDNNGNSNNSSSESFNQSTKTEKFTNYLDAGLTKEEPKDMYLANMKTSGDCGQNSLGLSTSTGYLCFTPEQLQYLRARGGNANTRTDF